MLVCEPSNDLEPLTSSFTWFKILPGKGALINDVDIDNDDVTC